MSADFGADLDAALKGHIEAIRAAGEAAKGRIDDGIAGVPEEPGPAFTSAAEMPTPATHGAAVDFDLDEAPLEFENALDADGIPMPEEI